MRINLLIFGTRGAIQPALALGVGLKRAGFEVQLVSFEEFRSLAGMYDVNFVPLNANIQEFLNPDAGKKVFTGTNFFELMKLFQNIYALLLTNLWQVSQGCDLLISNTATAMAVDAVAEKLQIPHIETSVFPGWPTRAFPSFFGPWPPSLGDQSSGLAGQMKGTVNRFSYKPVNWAVSLLLHPIVERCRREILGLPGKKPKQSGVEPAPILAGFSKHVLPRPSDWGENIHVTGYWYLDNPGYEPPPALQAFLAVAETGSFSRAAERIYLTQPAISKRIAALEKEVGARLFDRIGLELGVARVALDDQRVGHVVHRALEHLGQVAERRGRQQTIPQCEARREGGHISTTYVNRERRSERGGKGKSQ